MLHTKIGSSEELLWTKPPDGQNPPEKPARTKPPGQNPPDKTPRTKSPGQNPIGQNPPTKSPGQNPPFIKPLTKHPKHKAPRQNHPEKALDPQQSIPRTKTWQNPRWRSF